MSKSSLVEAFNIKKKENNINYAKDYEVFENKDLLSSLRDKIIENLAQKVFKKEDNISDYINAAIDNATIGHDLTNLERGHLYNLIDNEINGYGPLTEVLEDMSISKIMVNGPGEIYIEVDGIISKDDSISFIDNAHILRVMQKLLNTVGKSIDSKEPIIDTRLADGSRLNAIIPPVSTSGPVMTIHKFVRNLSTIDDMIRIGSCTPYMARFLEACVLAKLNILIVGNTGSGKTTLLNILGNFVSENERVVTIEETKEIELNSSNVISLETIKAYKENLSIKDLLNASLRMEPARIMIGELKGEETFDCLQVMNTSQIGFLVTIHANDINDALKKIKTMVLLRGIDIKEEIIDDYINNAIDIVVNIEKISDGKKKITSISELSLSDSKKLIANEIFAFKEKGLLNSNEIDGEYILYRRIPKIYEKILKSGVEPLDDMFTGFDKESKVKKKK